MFGCERWRSNNKLVQGERDRIKKDEDLADRIAELDSIQGAVLKAKFECAPQAGCTTALRLRELTQQTETLLGKTALTLVRKAALRGLLDQERMQNITELNQQGKTIYKQRV